MNDSIDTGVIDAALGDLSYPVMRTDAAVALNDVTVEISGEERSLGAIVSELDADMFDSSEMILDELQETLPEEVLAE